MKLRVAVFLGGRSPEHDVSVVTGLQALNAIDQQRFEAFPLYISTSGDWLVGGALRERANYLPRGSTLESLESVTLDVRPNVEGHGRLLAKQRMFSKQKPIEFDVALLAFHGLYGEDGRIQGLLDLANVPYTGMRLFGSNVCMDKAATKRILAGTEISVLPSVVLHRPTSGFIPTRSETEKAVANITFPVIVKPVHLGSSIGVAKASSIDELREALPVIFRLDTEAIVEPFVQNMVEYNVAVRSVGGDVHTSAIERPKSIEDLLTFKSKYLSGADGKAPRKTPGTSSEGMLSLTRDINPNLPSTIECKIRQWAKTCFSLLNGSGTPRIDFLSDARTEQIWLNEVNPCPGSFAFFLWEKATVPILFTDLLSFLIDEAFTHHRALQLPHDPTDPEARLFPHP
jgi:D-alanine-D-alanine ligase